MKDGAMWLGNSPHHATKENAVQSQECTFHEIIDEQRSTNQWKE
jgi:hypothetical protein